MKAGRLLSRAVVGGLFIGHGTQKWFGWWGGPGLERASKTMESVGLRSGTSQRAGGRCDRDDRRCADRRGSPHPALGLEDTGSGWALAALAAGAAGSMAVIELGRRQPPEVPEAVTQATAVREPQPVA